MPMMMRRSAPMLALCLMVMPIAEGQDGAHSISHEPPQINPAMQAGPAGTGKVLRTVMVTTSEGVFEEHEYFEVAEMAPPAAGIEKSTTLWQVDDEIAIAEGVALDSNNVWAAWRLLAGRLSMYPSTGGGTPDFEYSIFDIDNGHAGIAAAGSADRALYIEASIDEDEYWVHAFTSQSGGVPDWSFEFPDMTDTSVRFRHVAVSDDGSTAAAIGRNTPAGTRTLYLFDAVTGDVLLEWVDDSIINAVELSDDGSIALVTQQNLATVLDTATGDEIFQTAGSGGGAIHYRMSGDGDILVIGGFDLHVYEFDGSTYQRIIDFTLDSSWFGLASVVSRDGSTVGTLARTTDTSWLNLEAVVFDVESREMLGSHPVSGSGGFQGSPRSAASSNDGSVIAFGSWGTENQDWPEVMVFNRDVELIGAIEFPGSALSVDVSGDGQYVAAGAKAIHANVQGNGGRVELIEIDPQGNPIPVLVELDPESVAAGSEEITLAVGGSGFRTDSVVRFDGADRSTTFVDTQTLTAQIPASDLTATGEFPVTVFNPAPGGGMSQALTFEVSPPPPAAIDVDPDNLFSQLEQGQTETLELTVANLGGEALEWEVTQVAAPDASGDGTPDCALPVWLEADPPSGTVPGGDSQAVDVILDATGLAPGAHESNLCIASNDPDRPLAVIPVTLSVSEGNEIFDDRFEDAP